MFRDSLPTREELRSYLQSLSKREGRHRTDNRTGHYTIDGVTRSLSHLVEHASGLAGDVR